MASDIRFSSALLNRFLDQVNVELGTGALLRWYSGTKPATADTALSGNTVLAEQALATPDEFGAASGREITANTIGDDVSADATGTCTFASFLTSAGVRVIDITVGEAADSADMTVNSKDFQAGVAVEVTAFSLGLNL